MKFDRRFLEDNSNNMNLYLVAKYGLCNLPSRNLGNVKQKSPHFRGPLIEILVFSVVAGEGFEPTTFGLSSRRKYSNMWTYGNV